METEVTRYGFHTESRMRETCTYGSMRGRAFPRGVPLYSTPFCICFYCICRAARVDLRRILHPFRRVTAHASRNSAHDGEGEGKRGLGMGFHRVNYTIFAALRVGFGLVIRWLGG